MTLTIELTPEESRQVEEARRRGVDVDAILRQSLANIPASKPSRTRKELERILDGIAAKGVGVPVLPPEAFERESLYEESL